MFLRRSWNIGPAVQFSEPRNAIQVMCSQHDFDGMRSGTSGVHGAGIGNRSTAGYSHVRFLAQAAQAGVFCVELMTEISHHQGHDADRIHLRLHGSSGPPRWPGRNVDIATPIAGWFKLGDAVRVVATSEMGGRRHAGGECRGGVGHVQIDIDEQLSSWRGIGRGSPTM